MKKIDFQSFEGLTITETLLTAEGGVPYLLLRFGEDKELIVYSKDGALVVQESDCPVSPVYLHQYGGGTEVRPMSKTS